MFLTKKGFFKILIIAIAYFVIGSVTITTAIVFSNLGIDAKFLFVLGTIVYILNVFFVFIGRYAEGKGKLLNLGNKLVRKELRPAEFLKEYEKLKNDQSLVIKRPSINILLLVALAFNLLDDKENCLLTVDEMISIVGSKKRIYVELIMASFLFDYGENERAEQLFIEIQKRKLSPTCKMIVDSILKSDRAMAIKDYALVEVYNLNLLKQTFPKLDNLGLLVVHHKLGEVYENMQQTEKAISYYQYCCSNGGETALKTSAESAIERLKKADDK